MKPLRAPVPVTDPLDGRPVLLIPLANSDANARIFPEDYARIVAAGFSPNWCLNCHAVKVSDWRTNTHRVARLVARVIGDVRVSHLDKDPLNLRADNLGVRPFTRHKPRPHGAAA